MINRHGRFCARGVRTKQRSPGDLWPLAFHRRKAGGDAGSGALAIQAFDEQGPLCYKNIMTATLSVRLPAADKRRLFDAAARQGRSANELVREAIRREIGDAETSRISPLAEFFGSVAAAPPPPTNEAVRRAMRRQRR